MNIKRLEVGARDSLVILDDRDYWCRRVGEFLSDKLKEAGSIKTLHIFPQSVLESELAYVLRDRFSYASLNTGVACIFPGRSAQRILKNWEQCIGQDRKGLQLKKTFVSAHSERRFSSQGNPIVTVGEIWPEKSVCPEIQTIIAVDDVISSGATCRKLYERNYHKFPQAVWYAFACVSRLENIKGYKEVVTPLLIPLDASGLKVPINSLTTLMEEKDIVGRHYAGKHCVNPDVFLAGLDVVISESQDNEMYHMEMHFE